MAQPFSFAGWHEVAHDEHAFQRLLDEGNAINRFRSQLIEQGKRAAVMGNIAGYDVPVVNCTRAIVSELVGELAEGYPFAAGYSDKGNRRSWSLRSAQDGADVAKIAQRFGGGGHRNAAGFVTWLPEDCLVVAP
jgi:nanoRNase/pAp phosphatase (c-di-AMP/oligoRNAs hydrolase)